MFKQFRAFFGSRFRATSGSGIRAVAVAAVLLGASAGSAAWAQAGGGSTSRLPPPPVVDANVNQNETLANVRYDNKWDLYGGFAFSHFNAGPRLYQGSNLGGFDIQGTRWLRPKWGATANVRGYYGTNATVPNPYGIRGPLVFEHLALGGVTYRALYNQHAAINLHALAGGGFGNFEHALGGVPPQVLGLFPNGSTFAGALGGGLDLNRSPKLALRISPDYLLTRYSGYNQNEFAISVGILYRFGLGKGPHQAQTSR